MGRLAITVYRLTINVYRLPINEDADAKGASVAFGPYGRRTLFATTGGLSPPKEYCLLPFNENDNPDGL